MNLKIETIQKFRQIKKTYEDIDYCYIYLGPWYLDTVVLCNDAFNLESLDLTYNNKGITQEIFGFIVFKDGTWLARREYNGSEWWEYFSKPERI